MQFCVACQEIWRSVNLVDPTHGTWLQSATDQELRAMQIDTPDTGYRLSRGRGLACEFLPRILASYQCLGNKATSFLVRGFTFIGWVWNPAIESRCAEMERSQAFTHVLGHVVCREDGRQFPSKWSALVLSKIAYSFPRPEDFGGRISTAAGSPPGLYLLSGC